MAYIDPVTGPIPRSEFREFVKLPFGEARERIRKYIPHWGVPEAEREWRVTFSATVTGERIVKAASEEDAISKADKIQDFEIDFDDVPSNVTIDDVEAV